MLRIKERREELGWTQPRARFEIELHARALGISIANDRSLKTMLSRWENGHSVPEPPYRQLLSLAYQRTPEELGFPAAGSGDVLLGLAGPGESWVDDVAAAAELWTGDMDRRSFLRTAGMNIAALAGADSLGQAAVVASNKGPVTVGASDVTTIRTLTAALRDLDNRFGGGQIREVALNLLVTKVKPLLTNARFDSTIGSDLLRAAAELGQLVGWASFDMGLSRLGQSHLQHACNLASRAGDNALVGELLSALSHHASHHGHFSKAVTLAQSAATLGRRQGISALVAEASVMEAHGHAGLGDEKSCTRAIGRAEAALDKNRGDDPQWISWLDEAYLSAKFGHCFRELNAGPTAARLAERSLDMDGDRYARGRAFNLSLLAHSLAQSGDIERACHVGQEAVAAVAPLKSARAHDYLRSLRRELNPAATSRAVQRLDESLRPVLAQAAQWQ